jgi:hypothetical protein
MPSALEQAGFLPDVPDAAPPAASLEAAGFLPADAPAATGDNSPVGQPATAQPSGYFDTLKQMFSEGGEQVGAGLKQATHPGNFGDVDQGVTTAVLGGLGMAGAPFNAALRNYVSQPLEEKTGIPKEYTELATAALPLPMKRLPALNAAAKTERADHIENLFNAANDAYEAARKSPVTFAPEQVASFKGDLLDTLKASGHRDFTAPKTFRTLDELSTTEPTTAGDAIAVRKVLSKLTKSPDEGSAAVTAMKGVDDLLSAVPEADVARKNYAAASRAETVNDALDRAQLNAETSGSGTNLDNTTRQAIKSILLNPKARRGFSEEELAQMAQISRGTFVGNVSRWVGNMLGGGHSAMGVIGGEVVGGHMGAAAAPLIGGVAKKLGAFLTQKQVTKLDELMRSRTPEAQAKVVNPLSDWNAAAEEFRTSPVARNLARVSIASRNLSNNLGDLGINLSPENLIRSVLPSSAASEGTQ